MKDTQELIHELLSALVDRPDRLQVRQEPKASRVYWVVNYNEPDYPQLIGKKGAHVKAMAYLIRQFGITHNQIFELDLQDPVLSRIDGERSEGRPVNHQAMLDLLAKTLRALGVRTATPGLIAKGEKWELSIDVKTEPDFIVLTVPPDDEVDGMTEVAALGTIFRAIAGRWSMTLNLEIVKPCHL